MGFSIGSVVKSIGNTATSAAKGVAQGATSAAKGVTQGATSAAKGVAQGATNAAKGVAQGATSAAKGVAQGATSAAKGVAQGAASAAKGVGNVTKEAGSRVLEGAKDVVHFSQEAQEWQLEQAKNFGGGVFEWGKGIVDTVKGVAQNPLETAKAVGKLATNPVLNPVLGLPTAAIQGKNPVEAYKEGFGDLKKLGTGIADDYKEVYNKHGVAGIIGYLAPDVAISVLTGGSAGAAKTAGAGALKSVSKEVGEEAVSSLARSATRTASREVTEQGAKSSLKTVTKQVLDGLNPIPSDFLGYADAANTTREALSSSSTSGGFNPFRSILSPSQVLSSFLGLEP